MLWLHKQNANSKLQLEKKDTRKVGQQEENRNMKNMQRGVGGVESNVNLRVGEKTRL